MLSDICTTEILLVLVQNRFPSEKESIVKKAVISECFIESEAFMKAAVKKKIARPAPAKPGFQASIAIPSLMTTIPVRLNTP